MSDSPWPKVGVSVLIFNEGKLLLGERMGSHGAGNFAPPGGHIEPFEDPIDTARRETLEETGLTLGTLHKAGWTHDVFATENKHYITLYVYTNSFHGEVQTREPHKCRGWDWFALDSLPTALFLPIKNLQREPNTLNQLYSQLIDAC